LIADYGLIRLGVRKALEDDVGIEVCAEAGTADEAIAEADATHPDVCLIGWDIPGGALTAIRGIFEVGPRSGIVILASTQDVEELLEGLRAGAVGYVPGNASSEGLRRVIRGVMADEAAVPRSMVRDLVLELRATRLGTRGITHREAQVLAMLRLGLATADIAERLRISPVTVRRHISDLVQKLDVEDRKALIHGSPESTSKEAGEA
jgi:DNA-binding NarL/FixJ family response regulator